MEWFVVHWKSRATDKLSFGRSRCDTVRDSAAVVLRLRKFRGESQRGFAELRRIDSVVHKRRSQRNLAPALQAGEANVVKSPAKAAAVGTKEMLSLGIRTRRGALIPSEEEQLVLDHWSANGTAKLVPLERIALWREKVSSIELVVADEFEQVAVKIVCSRLRHAVDGCPGVHSVLGHQRTGLHFEFLQGIREGKG